MTEEKLRKDTGSREREEGRKEGRKWDDGFWWILHASSRGKQIVTGVGERDRGQRRSIKEEHTHTVKATAKD